MEFVKDILEECKRDPFSQFIITFKDVKTKRAYTLSLVIKSSNKIPVSISGSISNPNLDYILNVNYETTNINPLIIDESIAKGLLSDLYLQLLIGLRGVKYLPLELLKKDPTLVLEKGVKGIAVANNWEDGPRPLYEWGYKIVYVAMPKSPLFGPSPPVHYAPSPNYTSSIPPLELPSPLELPLAISSHENQELLNKFSRMRLNNGKQETRRNRMGNRAYNRRSTRKGSRSRSPNRNSQGNEKMYGRSKR